MTEYRFAVNEDGTIQRARKVRIPDDWQSDEVRHYFDSDSQVAVTDNGWRGWDSITEGEDTDRTLAAIRAYSNYDTARKGEDRDVMLKRLARRITASWGAPPAVAWASDFIVIGVDRGQDCYVLAWGGDEDGELRREIDALFSCDLWELECEEYQPGFGLGGGDWVHVDYYDRFWGEAKVDEAWENEFPLPEFPIEALPTATD